jgi:hypothetical protein
MKNRIKLAVVIAAVLAVGVGADFVTARPAIAQGRRPAADVRVINGTSDPVPVRVSSLPAVQVSSLPAVQVSNLPAVQAPPEPITLSGVVIVGGGETIAVEDLSAVPAGKTLVLESFNWDASGPDHNQRHMLIVEASHDGLARVHRFVPGGRLDTDDAGIQVGEHAVKIFADEGTMVRIRVARGRGTAATTIHVTMTGYLVPAS